MKLVNPGDLKQEIKFAFLPTLTKEGVIWLEKYVKLSVYATKQTYYDKDKDSWHFFEKTMLKVRYSPVEHIDLKLGIFDPITSYTRNKLHYDLKNKKNNNE